MNDPCELCRKAQCPRVCYVQRDYLRHHGKTMFTRKNEKGDMKDDFVRNQRTVFDRTKWAFH